MHRKVNIDKGADGGESRCQEKEQRASFEGVIVEILS